MLSIFWTNYRRTATLSIWALLSGALLGSVYRLDPSGLGVIARDVAKEHFAPLSINVIGPIGLAILGLWIAVFGRIRPEDNWLKRTVQLGLLELSIAFSAIFASTAAGFAIVNLSSATTSALLAMCVFAYVVFVLIVTWIITIAHRGVMTSREGLARAVGAIGALTSMVLFNFEYM
jgi:hypothetical protein